MVQLAHSLHKGSTRQAKPSYLQEVGLQEILGFLAVTVL